MGACATKPKVAKDGDIAPVLRPEPEKKAVAVAAAAEVKSENVVVVKEEITEKDKTIDKVSEIVVDGDDQSAKRRSLSKLFKENEQAKEVVAESDAATNPEKQESMEIEKPQNLIIEERSVITLNPTEEVKPSEVVLQEAAAPKVDEQLETEIAIEVEKHEEKPEKQEEIKPVAENEEKQVIIVADDEKFADAPATIVTEKSLEPEEIKQVTAVVTETSLLEPKEKAEKQENIVVTDEKVANAQANISTEKSMEPEEIKQVTIVTEKSSSEPTEEKQETKVSEKPAEITESSTSSSAVVEIATPPVIEIKSSQPEKEEKAEEAK